MRTPEKLLRRELFRECIRQAKGEIPKTPDVTRHQRDKLVMRRAREIHKAVRTAALGAPCPWCLRADCICAYFTTQDEHERRKALRGQCPPR